MPNRYNQGTVMNSATHFSAAPMSGLEFSKMTAMPTHTTTFNAGDIVPVYCQEVLPHDTFDLSLDAVIRQNTVLTPTMANMDVDFYAFFVPNRIVNESWKNVNGENSAGTWVTPQVSLAPLYPVNKEDSVQIPVGSVADYYGLPTQAPIPANVLSSMNDLRFRGYLDIYNEYFRDQNYQAPIPFSKLNIYEGFLEPIGSSIGVRENIVANPLNITSGNASGDVGSRAVIQAIYGAGAQVQVNSGRLQLYDRATSWSALSLPLKANKKHDYFTSVLPSPQKGNDVTFTLGAEAPIVNATNNDFLLSPLWYTADGVTTREGYALTAEGSQGTGAYEAALTGSPTFVKLSANLSEVSNVSVNDLRLGAAIQQTYELLARGGSRYREFVKSFFGIETDDPFMNVPKYLGHVRRGLDLYQTAQTSPSESGSTPQGNLAAFGYTSTNGHLFTETFLEHGFIHVFAVVRHQNVYPAFVDKSWYRLNQLDFYLPTLANISEQPIYTREINPFASDESAVFGYQEAWAEYRYEPSRVSGYMRTGIGESLALWNYADEFNSDLTIADGNWLKSNSAEVLDRSLAVTSEVAPQFKALFTFTVTKQRPMPTYSVPGIDII